MHKCLKSRLVALAVAGATLLIGSGVGHAAPPPLTISGGSLSAAEVGQVGERIAYWLKQLAEADETSKVVEARTGLVRDYRAFETGDYQYIFARELAGRVKGTFDAIGKGDELQKIREINLANAVAGVSQVSIQPALEVMVRHSNPAVRFLGWEGYRGVRMLVLGQGGDFRRRMEQSLSQVATKEDSPQVIGSLGQMMTLPPFAPAAVPANALQALHQQGWKLAVERWADWCRMVMAGDEQMAIAAPKLLRMAQQFHGIFDQDKQKQNAALQMVVDMMWCGAEALDKSEGKGQAAQLLLRESESTLNSMTGRRERRIDQALRKTGPGLGAAAKIAVLDWVELLEDAGVSKPDISVESKTTTQPQTAPEDSARS